MKNQAEIDDILKIMENIFLTAIKCDVRAPKPRKNRQNTLSIHARTIIPCKNDVYRADSTK